MKTSSNHLNPSSSYRQEALLPLVPGVSSTGPVWKVHKRSLAITIIILVTLVISLLLVLIFIVLVGHHSDDDPGFVGLTTTPTTYGEVQGFYYNATAWNGEVTTVKAWRGVPFASPPVGELRWKSPTPPIPWTGVLNCTEFKSPCVQADGSGSEDCLYLNIYSSVSASNPGPWPVYFDIYGGGLMGGSATADYNGLIYSDVASRAGSGLVVVAPAYRLNIFGFLATDSLTAEQNGTSGNYGIEDQIAALRWVQLNIKNFNGDPNNVIIGGFSSGGTSVFALLSSEYAKGLFAAAMSYSGSTNITMDLATAEVQNAPIVNASGCQTPSNTNDYPAINSCLRNLSVSELVSLIPPSWNTPGIWGLPLGPQGQDYAGLVIVDGKLIPQPFSTALSEGLIDVPFLYGNMGMEPDEYPDEYVGNQTQSQWYETLNQTFASWPDGATIANDMYQLYLNDSRENPQKAYDRIVADYGLYCSQILLAKQALAPRGQRQSPIYLYYDEWPLSQNTMGGKDNPVRYAYHGLFYLQLTDQWNAINNSHYLPNSQDLASQIVIQSNVWNFFLHHTPTSDWLAVNQVSDWPNQYQMFDISVNQSRSVVNYRSEVCEYYSSIGLISPTFWWCD